MNKDPIDTNEAEVPVTPEPVTPLTPSTPTAVETPGFAAAPEAVTIETVESVEVVQPIQSVAPAAPVFSAEPVISAPVVPAKKTKKPLFWGLIIAAVLVVLGGGAALAYNVWYQNPQKVVTDSLVNALSAKTVSMTGTFDVKDDGNTMKATIEAKSTESAAEVAVKFEYRGDDVSVDVKGTGYFDVEGNLFVKLENTDSVVDQLFGSAGIDASAFDELAAKVEGNWIKISNEDIGELSEEYKKTQLCLEDLGKKLKDDKSLSNEVSDLYKKNTFIVIEESLGSKTINGVGSLGYLIDVDVDKTKAFATGLADTQVGKKLTECDKTIDFKKFADDLTKSDDAETANGRVELWASRFGHELTEVSVKGTDDGTEASIVINPTFNKEVTIATPESNLTIEELMKDIQAAYMKYVTSAYEQSAN